jgi:ATP-dependent Clp protease protease subunit
MTEALTRRALKLRQIYLWGEIEDEMTYGFIHQMSYLITRSKEPIFIFIHSEGGCRECELAIVDEMEAAKKVGFESWTVVVGMAFSAAAGVLMHGTQGCRFARPNSAIMLHPCSFELSHDYEHNQRAVMEFLDKRCLSSNKRLAEACGMADNYDKFIKDIDKGLWLNAQEAVKYGVVDDIWTGPLPFGGP